MLILTRKPGESVYIGDNVKVTIVEIKGHQIRVGIDAPKELRIYREEIYLQILEENKQAAAAAADTDAGLEGLPQAFGGRRGDDSDSEKKKKTSLSSLSIGQPAAKDPKVVIRRNKKKSSDE